MIKWAKGWIFLIRQNRKQKKIESDLYKAKKHAILALAYWKDCAETYDLHFQIKESSLYVHLGICKDLCQDYFGTNSCQAGQKKNSEK